MRRLLTSSLLLLLASLSFAEKPTTTADAGLTRLPVRRVVLYKNGVGYFEHTGRISGDQELGIHFTTAQLNDVLKSLTVVDLGEGRVTGIRYDSIAPLDVRLRGLRLPLGEQPTQADFLNALRGSKVEVKNGMVTAVGRVLSIEKRAQPAPKGESLVEVTELSLVSDNGELRTFTLGPTTSVRVLEKELSQDVNRYLNLLESARSNDLRRMVISDSGKGERDLFVSYISEVPIWKSTYRIVLRKDAKPLLQGWAVVDNTVGEDWSNVQLTLVAGSPQSFVQDISQPLYARRPVVGLPHAAMLVPQSHEGTMQGGGGGGDRDTLAMAPAPPPIAGPVSNGIGAGRGGGIGGGVFKVGGGVTGGSAVMQGLVTDPSGAIIPNAIVSYTAANGRRDSTRTDSTGHFRFFNVPMGQVTLTYEAPGFNRQVMSARSDSPSAQSLSAQLNVGAATETVTVSGEADAISPEKAMEALEAEADGGQVGDLFEYDLKQRISIGKNQSALVPIINAKIDAEKVTIWNAESQRALRALWLKNTSGLTLDSGTFNIVEDGAFSGEGLLQPVKPDERRLISYAADTAVRVTSREQSASEPATRVRVFKGVMWMTREQRDTREYTVHNSDTTAREVVIEHPVREGWKLVDGLKPSETSASFYRFTVTVEPGATEKLEVKEFRPDTTTVALSSLTPDQVSLYSQQRTITPELEKAMRQILTKKAQIGGLENDMRARQQEIDAIAVDQARVRENMKALKGTPEEKALLQRYTRQLDSEEDRLAVLRKEIAGLKGQRELAGNELDRMIMEVSFEQGL